MTRASAASWVAALACAACSGGAADADADAGGASCLAFAADFAGFRGWPSYDVPGSGNTADPHAGYAQREYLNRAPPRGSAAFPACTLIVKEATDPAAPTHQIVAMSKRGGDYNASGAVGWEWLELKEAGDGFAIVWRGVGPPSGEAYGGDPTACNTCHAAARDNDSVLSPKLRLSSF